MAMDIGEVHSVLVGQRNGYGFNLKDGAGRRWMTLAYETEAEAKAAREKIIAATAGVIAAAVTPQQASTDRAELNEAVQQLLGQP